MRFTCVDTYCFPWKWTNCKRIQFYLDLVWSTYFFDFVRSMDCISTYVFNDNNQCQDFPFKYIIIFYNKKIKENRKTWCILFQQRERKIQDRYRWNSIVGCYSSRLLRLHKRSWFKKIPDYFNYKLLSRPHPANTQVNWILFRIHLWKSPDFMLFVARKNISLSFFS